MVVHNFHISRRSAVPFEADSPLLVDSDAKLSFALALECLQSVAGWGSQFSGAYFKIVPGRERQSGLVVDQKPAQTLGSRDEQETLPGIESHALFASIVAADPNRLGEAH